MAVMALLILPCPIYRAAFQSEAGSGAGLSNYTLGQVGGTATTTLTLSTLLMHMHGPGTVPVGIDCDSNPRIGTISGWVLHCRCQQCLQYYANKWRKYAGAGIYCHHRLYRQ